MSKCSGCETRTAEDEPFTTQCPLCQAEDKDEGFFCSQECFGAAWLSHRNEFHPSGVARTVLKKPKLDKKAEKKKRNRDAEEEAAADKSLPKCSTVTPWPVLQGSINQVKPAFKASQVKRAVISVSASTTIAPAPAADATGVSQEGAVFYNAEAVQTAVGLALQAIALNGDEKKDPVILCGSLVSLGLVGWAARCSGLRPLVVVSSRRDDVRNTPDEIVNKLKDTLCTKAANTHGGEGSTSRYLEKTVVLLLESVLQEPESTTVDAKSVEQAEKLKGSSVEHWMNQRTLITMPDLAFSPTAYQTLTTTAWMLVPKEVLDNASAPEADSELGSAEYEVVDSDVSTQVLPPPAAAKDVILAANCTFTSTMDNLLTSLILFGEHAKAAERFIVVYVFSSVRAANCLRNALMMNFGAFNQDPAELHSASASLLRALLVQCIDKLAKTEQKQACSMVCRAMSRMLTLPTPIPHGEGGNARNTALHATLCGFYGLIPTESMDAFAESWGLKRVVGGLTTVQQQINTIKSIVERIKHRVAPKQQMMGSGGGGHYTVDFAVSLMLIIRAESCSCNLTVEDLLKKTCWDTSSMLRRDFGQLKPFLADCDLLRLKTEAAAKGPLSGLNKSKQKAAQQVGAGGIDLTLYSDFVRPKEMKLGATKKTAQTTMAGRLPMVDLPLSGLSKQKKLELRSMAKDDILSAMPVRPIPMYLGDVGNLIGIWPTFNARYEGALPISLSKFLELFPDDFAIVGNIVTRKIASRSDQAVRISYSDKEQHGETKKQYDSDDEEEKRRDKKKLQKLLVGHDTSALSDEAKKRALSSAKARRQMKKKLTNKLRYDKNRKSFDPESMVPGYKKHKMVKVAGRGTKKNARRWKRKTGEAAE